MSRRRQYRPPPPTTDKRSPEVRLEAMVREPNLERARRTFGRILDDLDAAPEPGPWLDAARTLYERLIISEDTYYYFAEMLTQCILFEASVSDAELVRLRKTMVEIERAHGISEEDGWTIGEATDEWRQLNDEWDRRADEVVNALMRETGHSDLAAVREKNREEFDERTNKGRVDLWGEELDDDYDDDVD